MTVQQGHEIYYSNAARKMTTGDVTGEYVTMHNDDYYCIHNYDALEPFFITLISSSNHWLFISTTGGLTAGRIDANHALFPYYTVDKITENSENTGNKALLLVNTSTGRLLWEPFSARYQGLYDIERNLYKNVHGTAIIFEEINHDLGLTYRYAWRTTEKFGFVRTAYLLNQGDSSCDVEIVDGLQNILPAHATLDIQNVLSNLLDAYKYNELHAPTGLGLYSLSSRLTDLAEPSESLRTNIVYQVGLDNAEYLLSSKQLDAFRNGATVHQETKMLGTRGAYFVHTNLLLEPNDEQQWHLVAEIEQDSSEVVELVATLSGETSSLFDEIEADIKLNRDNLNTILNAADAAQVSNDDLSTAHHLANVLFNVMRGGIFANQYQIDTNDLQRYIQMHRPALLQAYSDFFVALPTQITVSDLRQRVDAVGSTDLARHCYSYLPLTFSRRHGDPSRPWNVFQINVWQDDGSQRLDYQGNWRDIFQNWEALSYSYPEFITGMISVFLNATTADGYNPYRLTRDGIDWEVPEPDNAWANIGYWNDHQIIYLEKLLEVCARFYPDALNNLLNQRMFSAANVPYTIKAYEDLIQDPYKTIEFDWDKQAIIQKLIADIGADGKLVHTADGQVFHTSLAEKLLLLLLTKLTNFVPEGGIWLNTQRPEWNDANNALVGKGLSVVTLAYLHRYVGFFRELLANSDQHTLTLSREIRDLLATIDRIMQENRASLLQAVDDTQRRKIIDALGTAGSDFRWNYYQHGVSNQFDDIAVADLVTFLDMVQQVIAHSLRANKRVDNLYHAYNTLHLADNSATVDYLDVMLEGQVAILSSGLLAPDEAFALLTALRASDLYRADQHSYILYPNRQLAGFLEKNVIEDSATVEQSVLITTMLERGDNRILTRDVLGNYHFQGNIRNANDVGKVLKQLAQETVYAELVATDSTLILDLFEQVFNHAAFTGRSGTFFAYEGLGSIYWHMISKLLLAAQESVLDAVASNADEVTINGLKAAYYDIRAGIGFNKTPDVYGAFPTDPYSHTPWGHGAKQPGMTGMVKEEILTRLVELGIVIEDGAIVCNPALIRSQEYLETPSILHYTDVHGKGLEISIPTGGFAFTLCQVPFVVEQSAETTFTVHYSDNQTVQIDGETLPADIAQQIYARTGRIQQVTITVRA